MDTENPVVDFLKGILVGRIYGAKLKEEALKIISTVGQRYSTPTTQKA